jgi:acetyl esterase/lipase
MRCDINIEDVEYNRPGGTPLLMRLYRPQGEGPFRIMVVLHGGGWCGSERLSDIVIL